MLLLLLVLVLMLLLVLAVENPQTVPWTVLSFVLYYTFKKEANNEQLHFRCDLNAKGRYIYSCFDRNAD